MLVCCTGEVKIHRNTLTWRQCVYDSSFHYFPTFTAHYQVVIAFYLQFMLQSCSTIQIPVESEPITPFWIGCRYSLLNLSNHQNHTVKRIKFKIVCMLILHQASSLKMQFGAKQILYYNITCKVGWPLCNYWYYMYNYTIMLFSSS